VTVFGPLLAVIYIGRNYLVFRDKERVTAITTHFDQLVRKATVSQNDLTGHMDGLIDRIS
jgi:hypothetical protein